MTGRAAAGAAAPCGGCELGRVRWHLERAAAELGQARWWWGWWMGGVHQLAVRRLGGGAVAGLGVLDDPGWARALRLGGRLSGAMEAAGTALEAAGAGGAGGPAVCPCVAAGEQ